MKKTKAIIFAFLAAVFYAISVPVSKYLLEYVPVTFLAAFLYLGAGIGVGAMYIFQYKKEDPSSRLKKKDRLYVVAMIVLDIIAPIFMMLGVKLGSASNASLLGNFEIVVTTIIALFIFKEAISKRLWTAIAFITISSIVLSFEGWESMDFSMGSLFVLLATSSWGLENNCTRKISEKSTYQIVVLKGIFSGLGAFLIGLIVDEKLPEVKFILMTMLLGFASYGLSLFIYIRAQNTLGAAKTSTYYAVAPFVGVFFAFAFGKEKITARFIVALFFMIVGTVCVVRDTIINSHSHIHDHYVTHRYGGVTHTHKISHLHLHEHSFEDEKHRHKHSEAELTKVLREVHI